MFRRPLPRFSSWLILDVSRETMSNEQPIPPVPNRWGQTGLLLSAIGFVHLMAFSSLRFEVVRFMTLFSLLGLAVSIVGLARKPRKPAAWGVALGLVGSMYLPTVFLPLLHRG